MKIRILDRIQKYLDEDGEAKRLLADGWEFLTDWTFFETMDFYSLQKETNRLIADYERQGWKQLKIHFFEKQCIFIWGARFDKK